ncbi:hypothetical protein P0L94_13905 [Microbacter sp. GSS18]|nr:hypothetical protein P0L94_13905 [Microbacter sp. GSS18]
MSEGTASSTPDTFQPLMMVGTGAYVCEGDVCFVPTTAPSTPSEAGGEAPAPPAAPAA